MGKTPGNSYWVPAIFPSGFLPVLGNPSDVAMDLIAMVVRSRQVIETLEDGVGTPEFRHLAMSGPSRDMAFQQLH